MKSVTPLGCQIVITILKLILTRRRISRKSTFQGLALHRGCAIGGGVLGRGFYAKSDKYALVQQSFLMYGRDGKTSVDIPDGAVLSISNKAISVSSAYHVPVGASEIKQNNNEVYSQ